MSLFGFGGTGSVVFPTHRKKVGPRRTEANEFLAKMEARENAIRNHGPRSLIIFWTSESPRTWPPVDVPEPPDRG